MREVRAKPTGLVKQVQSPAQPSVAAEVVWTSIVGLVIFGLLAVFR